MPGRFLRFADLKESKGLPWTRMHIDRLEAAGKFPRRVSFGTGTVYWVEAEIDAFVASAFAERDARPFVKPVHQVAA